MGIERLLGRGLALCCHPYAAWRVLPASGRLLLAGAYVWAGYLLTILSLLAAA